MADKRATPEHPIEDVLARRWSPYAYAPREMSDDDLRSLFEAARWAPSSYNEQPWRYIVARRQEGEAFARLLSCLVEPNREWARAASALALGVVSQRFARNDKPNKAAQHDLGLASASLCVEASARGLYVHQMIGILPDQAREVYAIPDGFEALTGLAIGTLDESGSAPEKLAERDRGSRTRRPLPEFVFAGAFGRAAGFTGGGGS